MSKGVSTLTRTVVVNSGRAKAATHAELLARTREFIALNGRRPKGTFWHEGKAIAPYHFTQAQQDEVRLSRAIQYAFAKARENHQEFSTLPELQKLYDLIHTYPNTKPEKQTREIDKAELVKRAKLFVEEHHALPRLSITKDGITLRLKMLSAMEREEVRLAREIKSVIRLDPQSKEAQELILLKEAVKQLQSLTVRPKQESKKRPSLEEKAEILLEQLKQFVETNNGRIPRLTISKYGYPANLNELSTAEQDEVRLARQISYLLSQMDSANPTLKEMKKLMTQVPQKEFQRQEEALLEEVQSWLESHNNKLPRYIIYKHGIYKQQDRITPQEKKEISLRRKIDYFLRSPKESETQLKLKKLVHEYSQKKTPYYLDEVFLEEVQNWIANHGNRLPRQSIKNGLEYKRSKDLTPEERKEVYLRRRIDNMLRVLPDSELLQMLRELKESAKKKHSQ